MHTIITRLSDYRTDETPENLDAFMEEVVRFARNILVKSKELVQTDFEDITQEVATKVFRKLHDLKANTSLFGLISVITDRTRIDHFKKMANRNRYYLKFSRECLLHHQVNTRGSYASPASSTMLFDDIILLRASIAKLTPDQQRAITLHYFDGLTVVEMQKVMNMPLGTVKNHLRRGFNKLKDIFLRKVG